jgi:hypothetical protein
MQRVQLYLDQWKGSLPWRSFRCPSCHSECSSRQTVSSTSSLLNLRPMHRHNSYRFRLVSLSCDPSFLFSIDGHKMTVIEVEGTNVKPLLIDAVEVFAGARCSKPVICSINQRENRSTLLGCCKMLLFTLAQDGRPYMFIGYCEPASCQLLYVFRILSVARINVNRGPFSPRLWGSWKFQFHQFYKRGRSSL